MMNNALLTQFVHAYMEEAILGFLKGVVEFKNEANSCSGLQEEQLVLLCGGCLC
jgi:hypothetical protein